MQARRWGHLYTHSPCNVLHPRAPGDVRERTAHTHGANMWAHRHDGHPVAARSVTMTVGGLHLRRNVHLMYLVHVRLHVHVQLRLGRGPRRHVRRGSCIADRQEWRCCGRLTGSGPRKA